MICPKCAHEKTRVIGVSKSTRNKRFRKCEKCGYTFMTVEAIEFDDYWKEYAKEIQEDERGKK